MENILSLKWNNYKNTYFNLLSNLRGKPLYSDATIACERKFYPVHKFVLASCSDYFSEIFESTSNSNVVIVLQDVKQCQLELLLDYMYIGEVQLKENELLSLIKTAKYLKIKGLDAYEEKSSDSNNDLSSPCKKLKVDMEDDVPDSPYHLTSTSRASAEDENTENSFLNHSYNNACEALSNLIPIQELSYDSDSMMRPVEDYLDHFLLRANTSDESSESSFMNGSQGNESLYYSPRTLRTSSLNINIDDILSNDPMGSVVANYYALNKKLDRRSRQVLTNLVVGEMMRQSSVLKRNDFEVAADKIATKFPGEMSETYYMPAGGVQRLAKGKLVDKYRNTRRALLSTKSSHSPVHSNFRHNYRVTSDMTNKAEWLKSEREPWSEVIEKWKDTIPIRVTQRADPEVKSVASFFEEWPVLRHPDAFTLIDMDFEAMFPGKEKYFLNNWPKVSRDVHRLLKNKLKDSASQFLLDGQYEQTDAKNLVLFKLLLNLYPPAAVITKDKRRWHPTVSEAQDAFITHVEELDKMDELISEKTRKLETHQVPLQPFIICVGALNKIEYFYIYIDGVTYQLPSLIKAIDCCFKVYQVFHTAYPPECSHIWTFIEKGLYKIQSLCARKKSPLVYSIISDLKMNS